MHFAVSSFHFGLAVGIFLLTYVIIISEKVHRTVIALAGALLMILLGIIAQEEAIQGVDFNTIGFLVGMMVIVGIARHSGMFEFLAIWCAKVGKGKPIPIFLMLMGITAVLSGLLDNVTIVLLIAPVTFLIASNLKVNPKPFLIGSILFSNIGGTATLIGDPPNILIGSAANLSFNEFLFHLGPVVGCVAVVTLVLMYFWYRKALVASVEAQMEMAKFNPVEAITDWPLLWKSLFVISVVLVGFITHSITHIEGATIALGGAALLLLLTLHEPEEYLRDIEWTTIFFFIGLFILVTGLEHVGAIRLLAEGVVTFTGGNTSALILSILWVSAIFSAIVDNIPFVATMIPLIKDIGSLSGVSLGPLWWALALGADLGGNFTIVGASANVVVSGMAAKAGYKIGFLEYMKTAVPMTFVALLICTVYMYFRYLV